MACVLKKQVTVMFTLASGLPAGGRGAAFGPPARLPARRGA